jgi:hypothetical protein
VSSIEEDQGNSETEARRGRRKSNRPPGLTKILKLLADILFERGEKVSDVHRLMQDFVDRRLIGMWHERYQQLHGFPDKDNRPACAPRLALPPIDFKAITVDELEKLTEVDYIDP